MQSVHKTNEVQWKITNETISHKKHSKALAIIIFNKPRCNSFFFHNAEKKKSAFASRQCVLTHTRHCRAHRCEQTRFFFSLDVTVAKHNCNRLDYLIGACNDERAVMHVRREEDALLRRLYMLYGREKGYRSRAICLTTDRPAILLFVRAQLQRQVFLYACQRGLCIVLPEIICLLLTPECKVLLAVSLSENRWVLYHCNRKLRTFVSKIRIRIVR